MRGGQPAARGPRRSRDGTPRDLARQRVDGIEDLARAALAGSAPTSRMTSACSASTRGSRCRHGHVSDAGVERRRRRSRISSSSSSAESAVTSSRMRQLNRRDVLDEIERLELIEQVDVAGSSVVHGVNGTNVGDSVTPASRQSATAVDEVGARVPLPQLRQHAVVDRFDRARDEQASGVAQQRQHVRVLQQVLDLDRDVVGDARDTPRASRSTTRRACVGPLKKSGSPNEMCCAPAATCARTSSSTTSTGTTRNAPR